MDTRICARCGTLFEPPREHSRFCSARCRVAWNGEHLSPGRWGVPDQPGDTQTQASALEWAIIGMRDTTERLGRVRPADCSQAFAVIGEAVWWVTIVDATMVRYHPHEYEAALAHLPLAERRRTEGTFGGLRFVRNRMGYHADHSEFIRPAGAGAPDSADPITGWTWRPLEEPALDALGPRGQTWEMKRYSAYQRWLAERTMEETFQCSSALLALAANLAGRAGDVGGVGGAA